MIPTLEIVHPDLPGAKMIINEADFDPSRHQRYGEPKGRKRSPEQTPAEPQEQPPEPISDLSQTQSPNLSEDQSASAPDLSEDQSPEPTPDLPEEQSPEPTPDLSEDLSPEPTLSEAQPPTYSQSDLEAKNITALRAIAAEKRIPRRMKLSRDELLQAILSTPTPPAPPVSQSSTASFVTFDL